MKTIILFIALMTIGCKPDKEEEIPECIGTRIDTVTYSHQPIRVYYRTIVGVNEWHNCYASDPGVLYYTRTDSTKEIDE